MAVHAALLAFALLVVSQEPVPETRPATEDLLPFVKREGFNPLPRGTPPIPAKFAASAKREDVVAELPLAAVGAKEGQSIADIGCGEGLHAFPLAQAVGPKGRVYCRDVSEFAIGSVRERAEREGVRNLDIALSKEDDVGLPASSVDVALLCDVYHIVAFSQARTSAAFLDSLHRAMKPGGVVVVCYARTNAAFGREQQVAMTVEDFTRQGFVAGWRWDFVEEPNRPQVLEFQKPAS